MKYLFENLLIIKPALFRFQSVRKCGKARSKPPPPHTRIEKRRSDGWRLEEDPVSASGLQPGDSMIDIELFTYSIRVRKK
jgi:hypothetical protein